jgi:hypothetical protein
MTCAQMPRRVQTGPDRLAMEERGGEGVIIYISVGVICTVVAAWNTVSS